MSYPRPHACIPAVTPKLRNRGVGPIFRDVVLQRVGVSRSRGPLFLAMFNSCAVQIIDVNPQWSGRLRLLQTSRVPPRVFLQEVTYGMPWAWWAKARCEKEGNAPKRAAIMVNVRVEQRQCHFRDNRLRKPVVPTKSQLKTCYLYRTTHQFSFRPGASFLLSEHADCRLFPRPFIAVAVYCV